MRIVAAGLIALLPLTAMAADIPQPDIRFGDSWAYRITVEHPPAGWGQSYRNMEVTRVTASSIYFTSTLRGSNLPPENIYMGYDWSQLRNVNGEETVINQPLSFPLKPGKTWELHVVQPHPDRIHKLGKVDSKYEVVGYEQVEVPAGKFNAIKIEEEGHWSTETDPGNKVTQGVSTADGDSATRVTTTGDIVVTGRTYRAYWYVPEVKRWVKSIDESYNSNGTLGERITSELDSFKLSSN